jgi:hypothetical protein
MVAVSKGKGKNARQFWRVTLPSLSALPERLAAPPR